MDSRDSKSDQDEDKDGVSKDTLHLVSVLVSEPQPRHGPQGRGELQEQPQLAQGDRPVGHCDGGLLICRVHNDLVLQPHGQLVHVEDGKEPLPVLGELHDLSPGYLLDGHAQLFRHQGQGQL